VAIPASALRSATTAYVAVATFQEMASSRSELFARPGSPLWESAGYCPGPP
jgi:hypothetical protein